MKAARRKAMTRKDEAEMNRLAALFIHRGEHDLMPYGLVLHSPVAGRIHIGVDTDLTPHVWWDDDKPKEIVFEFDDVPEHFICPGDNIALANLPVVLT